MHRCLLPFVALGMLAGCSVSGSGSDVMLKVPISGGVLAPVDIRNGNVVNPENDDIKIEKANFASPANDLAGKYEFGLDEKKGDVPRHITIEDVTEVDQKPLTLADDGHPQLKNGHWEFASAKIPFDDKSLQWLHQLDNSLRIYRFTIVTGEGSTVVMYGAGLYPVAVKEFVRKQIDDAATPPEKPSAN